MGRRLTAILAADVVGYSRLMGADEAGTLAAVKALRKELFAPKVAEHHGRIVKLMGDGALVEFASVIDAEAEVRGRTPGEVREGYERQSALRTFIDADDIARTALFLCSDAGARISGQTLAVDGGTEIMGS